MEERPRPCAMSSHAPGVQITALPLISLVCGSLLLNCIINTMYAKTHPHIKLQGEHRLAFDHCFP